MAATQNSLEQWIGRQLQSHRDIASMGPLQLSPLAGDAGFRQYYRVNTSPPLLAVSAPKGTGQSESASYFAKLSATLRKQGAPTPQVIACDAEQNFLLIEDFGGQSFLDVLNPDSANLLYSEALMVLLRLQQIPQHVVNLPSYDATLLQREMALFGDWFVEQLLGHAVTDDERQLFMQTFDFLTQQALSQPQVLVHRDYHSRNIMYREGEAPGVIDFQDAVWGPITYDLVSLLKDCYIAWPPEDVKRWLMAYGNLAMELGVLPETSEDQWQQWFDTMGMQRHIKVLGIFARLFLRDKKPQYLNDLPLVWHYTLTAAEAYSETQAFAQWCQQTLLPLVQQQTWYTPQVLREAIDGEPVKEAI